MALITCPECGQQISDQAVSCPHCGFPIQQVSNNQVVPARLVLDKKIMRIVVVLVIIGVLVGIGYAVNKYLVQQAEAQAERLYISEIDAITTGMFNTMADAEDMTYIAEKVWRYAIYKDRDDETEKYVFSYDYGYNTFDIALMLLATDDEILNKRDDIIKNSDKIKTRINALVVPEKYTNLHKEFIDLHVVFLRYVDLAVEPTGSYNSYSEAIVTNSERFLELYRTVTQKIPN